MPKPPKNTWINLFFKSGLVRRARFIDGKYLSTDNNEWFSGYKAPEDVERFELVDDNIWMIYKDNWIKFDGKCFSYLDGEHRKSGLSGEETCYAVLGMGLNGSQSDDAIQWIQSKELKDG
jgi:hypothetical protein